MTDKCPNRANRSTGSAQDYARMILSGHTQQQIADKYGVTAKAIRDALKSRGLATNSRALLSAIPAGCTPTDAEVLRRANHALIEENNMLRQKMARIKKALNGVEA